MVLVIVIILLDYYYLYIKMKVVLCCHCLRWSYALNTSWFDLRRCLRSLDSHLFWAKNLKIKTKQLYLEKELKHNENK